MTTLLIIGVWIFSGYPISSDECVMGWGVGGARCCRLRAVGQLETGPHSDCGAGERDGGDDFNDGLYSNCLN